MYRTRNYLLFVWVVSFLLLSGCQPTEVEIGPTPPLKGYGSLPTSGGTMPQGLDCSLIEEVALGSEWNGLRVGISSYENVLEVLNPESVYWDDYYGHVVFHEKKLTGVKRSWLTVRACFWGDTLSAIQFFPDDEKYPEFLEDFIEKFGEPDRVTWGYDDFTRTMIWTEEGIVAEVEHLYKGDVFGPDAVEDVKLFPPIRLDKLEESWLWKSIPIPEDPDGPEDWWGFND